MSINIISIIMAMLAYTCISAGFVLMKKGISWIGWEGKKNTAYYKNILIWISGFIIMNIYGVPSAIALKHLPAHIVAAFAGWGIIVLVLLSYFIINEKIYLTDYAFALAIIIGIILLNIFEKPYAQQQQNNIIWMIILCFFPLILFMISFIKNLSDKTKTVVFASVSGISAGLMVVFLGLLVNNYKYYVLKYFNSPYLYLYVFFALLSFFALQMALKKGAMIIIGPVQYASNIIYPLFASILIFNENIIAIQYLSIILIIYSVSKILKKH